MVNEMKLSGSTYSLVEEKGRFSRIETQHMVCEVCGTAYPVIDGKIICNGQKIKDCPYCV